MISSQNILDGRPILITLDVPNAVMARPLALKTKSRDACYPDSVKVAQALITAYNEVSEVTPVHQNLLHKALFTRHGDSIKAHLFDWEPLEGQQEQTAVSRIFVDNEYCSIDMFSPAAHSS